MGSNPTRSANFFIEIPCKAQCFTGDSVFRPDSPYLEARVVVAELEKKYLGYSSDIRLVESIIGCQTAHALLDDTNSASQTTLAYLNSWIKSREHKIETKERDGKAVKQFLDSLGRGRDMPLTKINMGMAQDFMDKELERISNGTVKRYLSTLTWEQIDLNNGILNMTTEKTNGG